MPRTYTRMTDKNNWTEESLKLAIRAVKVDGMKIRSAGKEFGIPESTLRKRLKENSVSHVPLGQKPTFSADEKELADHVLKLAKLFYGLTPRELRRIAFEFAEAKQIKHRFNKSTKLAGKDWLYLFLQRNPEISLRQPEGTSLNRINAFNKEEVTIFFSNLQQLIGMYRFPPNRIFNMDETGITTVQQKCPKIYGEKGAKRIGAATSNERGRTITAVFCVSASGTYIPPMLIYPRVRMSPQLQKNGPIGAIYACSKNGWTNKELYLDWLRHFKSHVKPTREDPVLLILDNHSSHISLEAYDLCKSSFITVLSLPPHTSHRTQPLDLTFFGPLKNALYRQYDFYLNSTGHKKITEYDLAELLNKAFLKVATMEKGISGFRTAGIYPLNPDRFDENDFVPSSAQESISEPVLDIQDSNSIQIIDNMDLSNEESVAHSIPQPTTSKVQVKITDISPIPSRKPHVARKRSCHSEILTDSPQKRKLQEKLEKQKKVEEKKKRKEDEKEMKRKKIEEEKKQKETEKEKKWKKNQARLTNFKTAADLFGAFEKIQAPKKRFDDKYKSGRASGGSRPEIRERADKVCYRCRKSGHLAAHCEQPTAPKRACYICESPEHMARECPKRKQFPTREVSKESAGTTSTNVVQAVPLAEPYMVDLSISTYDKHGNSCKYISDAIIDSGSPISLVRDSFISSDVILPMGDSDTRFCGINGARLRITGVFQGEINVQNVRSRIKFYTVPDGTMAYRVLLGRDFLTCPSVRVTLGKTAEIANASEESAIGEIMNIDCDENLLADRDKLQINPAIDEAVADRIRKNYESCYFKGLESEKGASDFEMVISLRHDQPISARPRRLSFADKEQLRKILDDLLEKGIIRPSNSPYASPIVLVRKKTGDVRLCYRELNKITTRDNFPTQLIDDNLDCLKDKGLFSILDLKDGFHHVKMHEESIKFTSFVTPLGQYEYLYMPFGLTNAPRVFQRFVNNVFSPLVRVSKVLLYLDDILVATENMEKHIEILSEVFRLAGKHRLRFRFDKCYFVQTEIKYLGYLVNKHGIRPSDENIESVLDYPIPRTAKDVHRFVSLASYFRRFVPGFSVLAKPLYDLIKKRTTFKFETAENQAFEVLKQCLASKPVLAIYSPIAETELHCDASASGFGGILLQRQADRTWRPISFWSQRTTPAESRYHSFELECLAVVYAIKRFHIYLAGLKFKIITDCDSFRLTLEKKDINPRISRWALFLQNYDYEIVHRPGKRMSHVDALSRCHSILVLEGSTFERTLSICQDRDEKIVKIRDELEKGDVQFYELRDGLVYRKDKHKKLLFYVPGVMESNVIRTCHDDIGHVGVDKTVNNIQKVYWFPSMREKVKDYVLNCLRCIEFSPSNGKAEGMLHSIPKGKLPFLTIHIDHVGPLEKTGMGYRHLLIEAHVLPRISSKNSYRPN
ncbi:PREDICTED: uncharacterized protein LOC105556736 [Vollenhovia emeryi]|uniref:uncharacterized protein LOC105556736 n=1 Tax=Vollenhovia emeryi TaxID=411798 RepID=UPI0005F53C92|nr:PREDICTED: uncharacterized protein LOC105556736 [Vollenhovia emeryi]